MPHLNLGQLAFENHLFKVQGGSLINMPQLMPTQLGYSAALKGRNLYIFAMIASEHVLSRKGAGKSDKQKNRAAV